jgi:hypothetical protein
MASDEVEGAHFSVHSYQQGGGQPEQYCTSGLLIHAEGVDGSGCVAAVCRVMYPCFNASSIRTAP